MAAKTMAQALAAADDAPVEESCIPVPLSEAIAKKINIASGEDANFFVDADAAWDWHEYEARVKGASTCTSLF
jgi:hypothetical protein